MRLVPVWGLLLAVAAGSVVGCGGDDAGGPVRDADAPSNEAGQVGDDGGASVDAGIDAGGSTDALCTVCGDCEESQRVTSARHVAGAVDYPDLPPTSGDHAGCWTTYRVHAAEVPDERWVHNLEHGAVVFLYNCPDGCPEELGKLTALIEDRPLGLVTPYAALEPGSFAAVAWGYRLVSQCFDEDALRRFYEEHVDRAPESIASGGSC